MNNAIHTAAFEEQVRHRAYALWESEGRPFGRDAEHWRAGEEAARATLMISAPAEKPIKPKAPGRKKTAKAVAAAMSASC